MLLGLWKSSKLGGPVLFPILFSHCSHTRLRSCRVVAPRTVMTSSKGLMPSRILDESSFVTDLVNGSCIAFQDRE